MTAPESKWVAEAMRLSDAICERNYDHAGYLAASNALRDHLQRQADLMERMGEALEAALGDSEEVIGRHLHEYGENYKAARLKGMREQFAMGCKALIAFQESKQ